MCNAEAYKIIHGYLKDLYIKYDTSHCINAGGDYLREQIRIARSLTDKPFGVNIMLMSPHVQEVAKIVAEEKVAVVTTGAGIPNQYVPMWKEAGIKVIPVAASVAAAKMMARAGADAVIAEGGESGGHIGELSTMPLVPQVQMRWISLYWRQAASATAEGWQRHLCWAQLACRWHSFPACRGMWCASEL